jgi:hypothetical protein
MQRKSLSKIRNSVISFFNKTITEVDKTVKFVKRKSKLGAQLFAEVLIMGCLSDPTISLERLCILIKQRRVKISKQGLHQRFNSEATLLMQALFSKSLQQFKTEKCEVITLLNPFSAVKMLDSSVISLPSTLKDLYKGHGGAASEAGLKIQVLFDYVQGQIDTVAITNSRKNDQTYIDHLNNIEKGSLYLQDLGYFKLQSFATIQAKEAYFISRYGQQTHVLDTHEKRIDLLKELRKSGPFFSKKIGLGKEEKIEVRLIAFRLSDEDIQKRLRKIMENARKHKKAPTKETLEFAQWSIYVTNVPENILNNEQVHLVYSLRWQIELFFKLCKSEAGIDKINSKKPNRVLCEFYAKLICIITLLYFCFPVRWLRNQELSFRKAYKELQKRSLGLFKALKSPYRLMGFIKSFLNDLKDFALKDKCRRKRRLAHQKLMDATGQEVLV